MIERALWCYCDECGKRIEVGDICFDMGIDTFCSDCVKVCTTSGENKADDFCGVLCDFVEDIIKRQKEEIERLSETLNATIEGQKTLQRYIAVARADSVKEFAERLVGKAKSKRERFLFESLVKTVMDEILKG